MDKTVWTYKKLGEVASYINGYPFKPEQWKDKGFPIVRIQNLNNAEAPYNYYDGEVPDKIKIKDGDLLISWSASLGTYIWQGGDAYLNQHIFKVVFDKIEIDKMYLKYAVSSKLMEMANLVHGATMKHIVKSDFDNTKIPYPPKETQRHIVDELDAISKSIEMLQEQTKDLDVLAQSIFYDMFGDPMKNEKGWESKQLGESCSLSAGGDVPKNHSKEVSSEYNIPIFSNGVENQGLYGYTDKAKIFDRCITISGRGTIGVPFERTTPFVPVVRLIVAIPKKTLNSTFLLFWVKIRNYKGNGGAIPQLTVPMLKNETIIIPPLNLQQSFASKISSIEEAKASVRTQITELQILLASRMQYWFD